MKTGKQIGAAVLAAALSAALLAGCGTAQSSGSSTASSTAASAASQQAQPGSTSQGQGSYTFTDAVGNTVTVESTDRVVATYGSYAETWTLAGGTLVGATQDAIEERGMDLGEEVAIIGTVKEPNLEEIIAADPDFVIMNADTSSQVDMDQALTQAGITHAYYRVDSFEEYLDMLAQLCQFTGRQDLYEQNGLAVKEQIDGIRELVKDEESPTVLLLRAYSTGVKAKGADNMVGYMLEDLGADNMVARHESLLEDINLEEIIAEDPDYIFITTMGSEQQAMDYMAQNVENNPAWQQLTAVQNDRCLTLPKDLFHYKPNARWGESYAYLAKILYPELAGQIG